MVILVFAARDTLRKRKFGTSHLELVSGPVWIGGKLEAVIQAPIDLEKVKDARATFACVYSSSPDTEDKVLWKEDRGFGRAQMRQDAQGVRIAVEFELPANLPETHSRNFYDSVSWMLNIAATVPGMNYVARFEVPVFKKG